MAGINDNDILDRILENLTHAPNNLIGDSASDPKFSEIIFGDAPNDKKETNAGNVAYVRAGEKTVVSSTRMGTHNGRKRKKQVREYWIQIISKKQNEIAESIREVNTLTFKASEVLEKNTTLTKPDGTLPLALDLEIYDVPRDVSRIGKDRQSNTIILRYTFPIE